MLEEFVVYTETAYSTIKNKRISQDAIDERIRLTFGLKLGFRVLDLDAMSGDSILDDIIGNEKYRKQVLGRSAGKRWTYIESLTGLQQKRLVYFSRGENESGYVLEIMKNKLPGLFAKRNSSTEDLSEGGLLSFEVDKFYVVSEDPKSMVNSSKNFLTVNKIIARTYRPILIKEEAMLEFERIKADESNGVDDLLSLL